MKEFLDIAADFISKVGFPVFVAIVLMWREDTRHSENLRVMADLVHTVKDQHLAVHCRHEAKRLEHRRRARATKGKAR